MNKETISQIKARLQTITDATDPYLQTIRDDSRKGVQMAIQQFERRLARQKEAEEAFNNRFKYEKYYWENGCQYIAGMDEVGRGPLAGPVVTCAVILNADFDLIGVTDSKQLTRHERENLYLRIVDEAVEVPVTESQTDIQPVFGLSLFLQNLLNPQVHIPLLLVRDTSLYRLFMLDI